MKPLEHTSHSPLVVFLFNFIFFSQLNIPQPHCYPPFLMHLHWPASCPHFIFGFTTFCTTSLFIHLNEFSVLKSNKLKQKSHLRVSGQCWKLAFLMKTMHGTCDSEVDHDTRPDSSAHGSLSHLLPRMQLFQKMLSCWQIHTFFIPPYSSHCLAAAFTPASLTPCPYLCVLYFVTAPALLRALAIWATPATRSHQDPPPSNLEITSDSLPGFCGFSLVLPITVWPWLGGLCLARLGDNWRGESQSLCWIWREAARWLCWSWVSCMLEPRALNSLVLPGYPLVTTLPTSGGQAEITNSSSVQPY